MPSRKIGYTSINKEREFNHSGDAYPHEKKAAVVKEFLDLWETTYPLWPTFTSVAKEAKVSIATAISAAITAAVPPPRMTTATIETRYLQRGIVSTTSRSITDNDIFQLL